VARRAIAITSVDRAIAANLRRLRDEKSMSQQELSSKMVALGNDSFLPNTISKIETLDEGANQRRVSASELVDLASVLDVPTTELTTPYVAGSDLLRTALELGDSYAKSLRALRANTDFVLDASTKFAVAHEALAQAGEYTDELANGGYGRLVRNLAPEVIASLKSLHTSTGGASAALRPSRTIVGEWTTPDGAEISFQADSEDAVWSWEHGDQAKIFREYQATGETGIEDFRFLE
jgi:transcriptional regulator with XRE-family HTH domain